jgi:hypothetical protein
MEICIWISKSWERKKRLTAAAELAKNRQLAESSATAQSVVEETEPTETR